MKDYELTVLFHPDLEMNLDPALEKVRKIVKNAGGTVVSEEPDGKKRTAYKIKGHDFALFHFFVVSLPADAPKKINDVLNITEEVLRHLLVKVDPRKAKYAAKRMARQASSQSADSEITTNEKEGE